MVDRQDPDVQSPAEDLMNQTAKNLSRRRADRILNKFDLDELEEVHRAEVLEIDGIGEKSTEAIGIWDQDGFPVERIVRNACPVCHEQYSRRVLKYSTTTKREVPGKVCNRRKDRYMYFHE